MALFNAVVKKVCYVLPFALVAITGLPLTALAQQRNTNNLSLSLVGTGGIKFANCAEMQAHFNSLQWEVDRTIFSGFEKREKKTIDAFITSETCFQGYKTEISPMGTLICAGYIERRGILWKGEASITNRYNFHYAKQTRRDSCRYKD
jgi:hypothetical protein